jgi:hypothetical protein
VCVLFGEGALYFEEGDRRSSNRWYLCTKLHDITSQKIVSFNITSVRTWCVTEILVIGMLWDLSLAAEGFHF